MNPAPGRLASLGHFRSKLVEPRTVQVWVPPGRPPEDGYGVLYMHDGQNLFSPKTSFLGVDWDIPGAITRLTRFGSIPAPMVVGVWNTPLRLSEYMPAKAMPFVPKVLEKGDAVRGLDLPVLSDRYLRFLVEELKPYIDKHYPTRDDPRFTAIMGSSMGGLISLYAVCEYPHVFGGAGCISTHWPAGGGATLEYVRSALPKPGANRFYFDYGTETIDAPYEGFQRKVDAMMREAGYTYDRDWLTCKCPGQDHSEMAWRVRVTYPLEFLTRGW